MTMAGAALRLAPDPREGQVMAFDTPAPRNVVSAPLNFLVPMAEKPVSYNYEPPSGVPWRTGQYVAHTVPIIDGRLAGETFSLDEQGFLLTDHQTAVRDFYDPDEVEARYHAEVEALVKQVTGAARVVVFDTTLRSGRVERQQGRVKEPARRIHNDYTENSGPQRVRDLLPDEAPSLLKRRFAVINVWRPIVGPLLDAPLALCDARSIDPADLVATDLKYPNRTGETYSVTFNPEHRWYYFPRMRRDEAVLIKCYDSARDGRAGFTAHGAFDDPTMPADAPPRESIEARTLVFFDA
jgi:hypothetical protein